MSVTMRILQQFDPAREAEFMALEKKFAELEKGRADLPSGTRMQPIASIEPCNTLIWQGEFPDIETAYRALELFGRDVAHEELLTRQLPLFKQTRIEFYKNL
jgi:hypothetical protein